MPRSTCCCWNPLVVFLFLSFIVSATGAADRCSSDSVYSGLEDRSFSKNGNRTLWGVCNYPNPQKNFERCGRSDASWLCDADNLLSKAEANQLDELLSETYNATYCRCKEKCSESYRGHPVMVLLLDQMRLPDLSDLVCSGGPCGELYPQLDPAGRTPSNMEVDSTVERFAKEMLRKWRLGRCSDDIVIVYVAHNQRLEVAAGELAKEKLAAIFESAQTHALVHLDNGDISAAISGLVMEYTSVLENRKQWPLILGITLSVIIVALMVFGFVMTVIFCRKEFAQGKTCSQVCAGCAGGEFAILFGGHNSGAQSRTYKKTNTADPSV